MDARLWRLVQKNRLRTGDRVDFDFFARSRYTQAMLHKLSSLALVLGLLALPACERDAAGTASPAEAAQAPETPAAPAQGEAKGEGAAQQELRAAMPEEGSACPEGKGPGDKWKVDCNTCFCSPEGKVACTLMACIDDDLE